MSKDKYLELSRMSRRIIRISILDICSFIAARIEKKSSDILKLYLCT